MSLLDFVFRRGPKPIGTVRLSGGRRVVELWGKNVWKVTTNGKPDPRFARNLEIVYADRLVYRGPQDGYYGYAVLKDVAERFGGTFVFHKPKSIPRGVES